ncbi:hypothetical protein [Endozoicomonas sp. ONNA2]|uniref:hypothetical protein n=1 Tax=Endozoicomonas sp. ONNA2 TaxID=2828741 RepID=UPI002148A14C|nr:hypothetical protein [Endozoicomonas sp. ONNA2]
MLLNAFFIVAFTLFFSPVSLADSDCNKSDADCDNSSDSTYEYWIKIKRLYPIDMGQWGGEEITSGATEAATDGRLFCLIAYRENLGRPKNRVLNDLEVRFDGPKQNGQYVLEGGSNHLPVTLTLVGADGDSQSGFSDNLLNAPFNVMASQQHQQCRNNEYILRAEIQRSDILNNAFTNRYESQFTLIAERYSPQLTVEVEFTVSIELEPVVRISGLEDMTIHYTAGSNVDQEQTFCVYGFGTTNFKIGGESTYGSGQFFLSNGNDNIEYGLAVGKVGSSGQGNTKALAEGGGYETHPSWQASDSIDCDNGNSENMRLNITIQNSEISGKPAGVYQDTAYLTVAPD